MTWWAAELKLDAKRKGGGLLNLYYGAVKNTPFRWLNLTELSRRVLPPGHIIEKVKYFTARVSGAVDPDAPRRQQMYLSLDNNLYVGETFGATSSRVGIAGLAAMVALVAVCHHHQHLLLSRRFWESLRQHRRPAVQECFV